ncbi:serpentine type 7TM GPCR chemoreceptor srh domain-containing protein [Ditylenchus destructor]|uniref:Serpentine type 7TM GPCR chemoreceptor srh domain-containing protein n=1 Tax=Ditylenchus destructor TaxID=166010 RepID=A0AAD4NB70_9BILA|nr:serpentine type 7TM GPCR chemoreceptor srh domain-containing protein [Ditylenchus destructor]
MSVKFVAGLALGLGLVATLACLFTAPMIFGEIQQIRTELADEMQIFRVQSDELWSEMVKLGAGRRVRRQAGYGTADGNAKQAPSSGKAQEQPAGSKCNCENKPNKCPPGPPGPKGIRGIDGQNGAPGVDGTPGVAADDVQAHFQQLDKCFHCPIGPPGPPGPPGRAGPRGMRGAKGQPGVPGRDGQPGFPGGLGPQGKQGTPGEVGAVGVQGDDVDIVHGRPGLKGPPGPIGPEGDPGPPGVDGPTGPQGPEGDKGAPGIDGKNGATGDPGEPGDEGEPGLDAEYFRNRVPSSLTMDLYESMLLTIAVASVTLQTYVIVIVIRVSPPAMATYRYFLCFYTFWDLLFTAVVSFVIMPDPVFPAKAAIIYGPAKYLGQQSANFSMAFGAFIATALVASQDYCLIYRLTVVLEDLRYHRWFLSKMGYLVFHFIGLIFCTVISVSFYYSVADIDKISAVIGKYPEAVELVPPGAILICLDTNLKWSQWMIVILISSMVVAEFVSFGVSYGIMKTLSKNSRGFSAKTYRMHRQLTYLLVAQLSTPIFFVLFPVAVALWSMVFHVPINQLVGRIGFMLFSLYASTNSCLTIFFVGPYRIYTVNLVTSFIPDWKVFSHIKQKISSFARNKVSHLEVSSTLQNSQGRNPSLVQGTLEHSRIEEVGQEGGSNVNRKGVSVCSAPTLSLFCAPRRESMDHSDPTGALGRLVGVGLHDESNSQHLGAVPWRKQRMDGWICVEYASLSTMLAYTFHLLLFFLRTPTHHGAPQSARKQQDQRSRAAKRRTSSKRSSSSFSSSQQATYLGYCPHIALPFLLTRQYGYIAKRDSFRRRLRAAPPN